MAVSLGTTRDSYAYDEDEGAYRLSSGRSSLKGRKQTWEILSTYIMLSYNVEPDFEEVFASMEHQHLFTFLYGLYPLNLLSYLKEEESSELYSELEDVDEELVKARSEVRKEKYD